MADTSFVAESAADLAAFLERIRRDEETRKRAWRRLAAAAGVAVLHVAFIFMLLKAELIPGLRIAPSAQSPLLWIVLQHPPGAEKVSPETKPKTTLQTAPPIIVRAIFAPPSPNAITDYGLVLGRALACGANSFEYLTPWEQARCRRVPWHFKYDRYGYIVLEASPRPVEERQRASDIQAHERNTQPVCPTYIDPNAPCLSNIIHGGGPQ